MDNETVRKRLVNSNLLRIKAEMSDSVTCDDFDEDFDEFGETYDEIGSQPPRQQQVYQYLDMCLHGLTRDRYIVSCKNAVKMNTQKSVIIATHYLKGQSSYRRAL